MTCLWSQVFDCFNSLTLVRCIRSSRRMCARTHRPCLPCGARTIRSFVSRAPRLSQAILRRRMCALLTKGTSPWNPTLSSLPKPTSRFHLPGEQQLGRAPGAATERSLLIHDRSLMDGCCSTRYTRPPGFTDTGTAARYLRADELQNRQHNQESTP